MRKNRSPTVSRSKPKVHKATAGSPPKSIRRLWVTSTDVVKRTVYDGLNIVSPGPGFAHLPTRRDFLWFEQLVSERCVQRKINGVLVPRFELLPGRIMKLWIAECTPGVRWGFCGRPGRRSRRVLNSAAKRLTPNRKQAGRSNVWDRRR